MGSPIWDCPFFEMNGNTIDVKNLVLMRYLEISNLYNISASLGEYERTATKVPTMKSQGTSKNEANNAGQKTAAAAPAVEEKIDFLNVKTGPLFEEIVDFETFSKSDFRAVKVLECEAVAKSKKLLKFVLDDGTDEKRVSITINTSPFWYRLDIKFLQV